MYLCVLWSITHKQYLNTRCSDVRHYYFDDSFINCIALIWLAATAVCSREDHTIRTSLCGKLGKHTGNSYQQQESKNSIQKKITMKSRNKRKTSSMKIFYEILLPETMLFTMVLSVGFALLVTLFSSMG